MLTVFHYHPETPWDNKITGSQLLAVTACCDNELLVQFSNSAEGGSDLSLA